MYFIYNNLAILGATILEVSSPGQATTLASQLGLVQGEYGVFDNISGLPVGWESYPSGVTFVGGPVPSYGYSLTNAKTEASKDVKLQNAEASGLAANNLSANLFAAQATLPLGDRLNEVVTAMSSINTLGLVLQSRLDAIQAATSISELNDIVNPGPTTGILSTGRGGDGDGPLDLNNSIYLEFNSTNLTESDTELYVPGTDTVISYGSIPGGFTSNGDCFTTGDYRVQIRVAATGVLIAQFECPLAVEHNEDITF
jgi:hypothetical protein